MRRIRHSRASFVAGVVKVFQLEPDLAYCYKFSINGKPVEVRRTVTLSAGTLTTLKETRPAGGTFPFRNQSTYTRVR